MSLFHASIRDLLEDVYRFLTFRNDSSTTIAHRERLLSRLKSLQHEYPELQLQLGDSELDSKRCSTSSPLPYVDMNGGSPYKIPFFSSSVEKENYDVCVPKDKSDTSENQSIAESDGYTSDEAKLVPEIPASDLYSCDKSGYLDKRKRESIKGWLNPFQKRWCAIKDGVLYYFEKTTDRKQRGSILLLGYEARTLPEDSKDGKKYNNLFELVCPGKRTYQFSAASDKDLHQWIEAVDQNSRISDFAKLNSRESQTFNANPKPSDSDTSHVVTEDIYETVDDEETEKQVCNHEDSSSLQFKDPSIHENENNPDQMFNYTEWYVGMWDCLGSDDSELTFCRGDMIRVLSKEYDHVAWWIGELQGKMGFVPKSYLMEAYETC